MALLNWLLVGAVSCLKLKVGDLKTIMYGYPKFNQDEFNELLIRDDGLDHLLLSDLEAITL